MRLNPEITEFLKAKILEISPEAKIYLFGSRARDEDKGGDIDILILSEHKLGFEGLIVTDWEDIKRLHERHNVAATPRQAVAMAINAGTGTVLLDP